MSLFSHCFSADSQEYLGFVEKFSVFGTSESPKLLANLPDILERQFQRATH
ncbi:hypothetical protein [Turicimonas muris]|uniref:hypothetical protein n=1 Tax=Turicimonas muris TaxID=1796652 RepID=UPI0025921ABB|nr:hypothetical protein [Turicimonas muris]